MIDLVMKYGKILVFSLSWYLFALLSKHLMAVVISGITLPMNYFLIVSFGLSLVVGFFFGWLAKQFVSDDIYKAIMVMLVLVLVENYWLNEYIIVEFDWVVALVLTGDVLFGLIGYLIVQALNIQNIMGRSQNRLSD